MKSALSVYAVFFSFFSNGNCHAQAPITPLCEKPLPAGVELNQSITLPIKSNSINGTTITRHYRIHIPNSYRNYSQVPVVFSFHGRAKNAMFQEELSQFSNVPSFDVISIYPEGWPSTETKTRQWQGDPDSPSYIDDISFTFEILDHLEKTYCVDSSRVWAAGKSNGGGFTGELACNATAAERFAAFAMVSAAVYLDKNQQLRPCDNNRKLTPVMEFHGLEDNVIKYGGGLDKRGKQSNRSPENPALSYNTTSIVTYVERWATHNNVDILKNTVYSLCDGNVTNYSWGDDVVVHYRYANLGHHWPWSTANVDSKTDLTCKEAEATNIIMKWFQKWTL